MSGGWAAIHVCQGSAVKAAANDGLPAGMHRMASTRNSVGSASAEKVASRLAPMPSKLEPVSSAAAMVKKRPRASR